MKALSSRPLLSTLVVLTGLFLAALQAHSETRTLTDKKGRSLRAEVVSVDGDRVTIKRDDGQTFTLSLATLSDDDQKSLQEWAKQQASLIPAGGVEVQISRGKFDTQKKDEGGITVSQEQWGYTVTLSNRTSKPLKNARVDYILFVKPDNEPGKDSTDAPLKQQPGSKKIEALGSLDNVVFRTDSITVFKQQLKAGFVWKATGNNGAIRDTLYGVWLRTYVGDQLVSEICSPEGLSKTEKWTAK